MLAELDTPGHVGTAGRPGQLSQDGIYVWRDIAKAKAATGVGQSLAQLWVLFQCVHKLLWAGCSLHGFQKLAAQFRSQGLYVATQFGGQGQRLVGLTPQVAGEKRQTAIQFRGAFEMGRQVPLNTQASPQ